MRDSIRAKTVGAKKNFKTEVVEYEGEKIEVRQPSVRARSAILKAAKALSGDKDRIELDALQVTSVIECCFDPESGLAIFEEADRTSMQGQPAGGFVDALSEVALRLMNVDTKEVAKNSERTPSDSSSSQ